jgi:hypothetical protein
MNFSSAPSSNPSPAPDSFNSQLHENNSAPDKAILDLNSPHFDAEYYVQDLLKRKGLEELVAVEQDMVFELINDLSITIILFVFR